MEGPAFLFFYSPPASHPPQSFPPAPVPPPPALPLPPPPPAPAPPPPALPGPVLVVEVQEDDVWHRSLAYGLRSSQLSNMRLRCRTGSSTVRLRSSTVRPGSGRCNSPPSQAGCCHSPSLWIASRTAMSQPLGLGRALLFARMASARRRFLGTRPSLWSCWPWDMGLCVWGGGGGEEGRRATWCSWP